jgi:hypothetical protein
MGFTVAGPVFDGLAELVVEDIAAEEAPLLEETFFVLSFLVSSSFLSFLAVVDLVLAADFGAALLAGSFFSPSLAFLAFFVPSLGVEDSFLAGLADLDRDFDGEVERPEEVRAFFSVLDATGSRNDRRI